MTIRKACIFLLVLSGINLLAAAHSVLGARPEYYGFSPAFPKSSELPPFESTFPYIIMNEQSILLNVEIDQNGSFVKAVPRPPDDSVILKYVFASLKKLSFEPALKNGKTTSSTLPVLVTINPRFRRTVTAFPVNADSTITNRSLYFEALEKLGVEFVEIRKFPPYFCDISPADSLEILPYALIKIKLDENGQINSSEIVGSNLPAFAPQLQSAALWADFSPLKLDGNAAPCDGFLLVSFLPQLQYPTNHIEFKSDSVYEWYERWRIQLLPDTVGLMFPPMPKQRDIDKLTQSGKDQHLYAEVTAYLAIDTVGNVRVISIDTKNPPLHKAVAFALKNVRFFPALNFNGKPVSFLGSARFSLQNRSEVIVDYLWLKY